MCQEHYDKVVQYAESIGDSTLLDCLERRERREQNHHHPCQKAVDREVELFYRPSLSRLGDPHLKNRLFMRMKILRYAADRDNRFGDVRTTVSDLRRGVYIRFVPCLLRRMTSDKTQLLKAYAGQSTEIAYHQDNSYIWLRRRYSASVNSKQVLVYSRLIRIFVKRNELRLMTIFDDYIRNKGCCKVSKTLLWDYDLTQFDWQRSRKVVVQRIIERGWLRDYFAAFDLYGGIEGFREIIKEVPTLSAQDMNFVCTAFGLKKEELRCYTRRQLRRRHLGC